MLQLLQIMNHMLIRLEYTPEEVREHFEAVSSGELTIEELLDICGIEPWKPGIMIVLKDRLPKWESALNVTLMRLGAEG